VITKQTYSVTWTKSAASRRPRANGEQKVFGDWESALQFYNDVILDRRTETARLVEITEREVRCFEHENRGSAEPGVHPGPVGG
jgi:hypothetical protein